LTIAASAQGHAAAAARRPITRAVLRMIVPPRFAEVSGRGRPAASLTSL
jgi:hypothetical protein